MGRTISDLGVAQSGLQASMTTRPHADYRMVDLAEGTGKFALAVAPVCSRVVAVDVSR